MILTFIFRQNLYRVKYSVNKCKSNDFDRHTHLGKKHPIRNAHFYHSKKFNCIMLQSIPLEKQILFHHNRLCLPVFKCHLNDIIWYALFSV